MDIGKTVEDDANYTNQEYFRLKKDIKVNSVPHQTEFMLTNEYLQYQQENQDLRDQLESVTVKMKAVQQENNKLNSIFDQIESLNNELKSKNKELLEEKEQLEEEIEE